VVEFIQGRCREKNRHQVTLWVLNEGQLHPEDHSVANPAWQHSVSCPQLLEINRQTTCTSRKSQSLRRVLHEDTPNSWEKPTAK
jgi:hypothetical protein